MTYQDHSKQSYRFVLLIKVLSGKQLGPYRTCIIFKIKVTQLYER